MLDIKKILGRSWHILWAYRMLWVFGFILALTTGANNFSENNRCKTPGLRSGDRQGDRPVIIFTSTYNK